MKRLIRDILLSAIQSFFLFAAPFCLFYSLIFLNPLKGICLGITSGFLYMTGIIVYALSQEKEGGELYRQQCGQGNVIIYTAANMFFGKESAGGRMIVKEDGMLFAELGCFGKNRRRELKYRDIVGVRSQKMINCFEVEMTDGEKIRIVMQKKKEIMELIRQKSGLTSF